ncbi:deoxyribose-phosphate aldolase [Paeniglutamicibacter sp. MACA_103]|uniref:deoxyribose-phosphate aldolase n=1 Tax=Paeniglutamicibacter sp. MACA_103 TaxID=3377337 RepID=UPI003893DD45
MTENTVGGPELAGLIDHTLLTPEATRKDVLAAAAEAAALGTYSLCVSPAMLPLPESTVPVVAVCGFPSGKHSAAIKAAEAAEAVANGASEIDMVINLGLATAGDFAAVEAEIAAVRAAVSAPRVLKVIIESAALSDAQVIGCCEASERAGADFVKTSTGFHPAGGASIHAVELMAKTVGGRLGVKASGGIRNQETALAMIAAGATRLGVSGTRNLLQGTAATSGY